MTEPTNGNGAANGAGNGSALDWLRSRHEALSRDRTMDYAVPGYQGRLVLRFGPAPWRTISRVRDLVGTDDVDGTALLNINCDVVISACRAVLCVADDGQLTSIDADADEPVRIDARLAQLLGSETHSARETLRWLFPHEATIGLCAGELLEWTQAADRDIATDFVQG